MPRKPGPPPVYDMQIEGLSPICIEHEVTKQSATFVDDFTGEVREVAPKLAQRIEHRAKVIEDHREWLRATRAATARAIDERNKRQRELTEATVRRMLNPPKHNPPEHKLFKRRF